MHKTFIILALFSMGFTHAAAGEESGALRLYPLAESKMPESGEDDCVFQLKGTKDPKVKHFVQTGVCFPCATKGRPAGAGGCIPAAVISINNNQRALPRTADGGYDEPAFYKYGDYVVEIRSKFRDCKNVSCDPFHHDAVLTVKEGSRQQTFEMQGNCDSPN